MTIIFRSVIAGFVSVVGVVTTDVYRLGETRTCSSAGRMSVAGALSCFVVITPHYTSFEKPSWAKITRTFFGLPLTL